MNIKFKVFKQLLISGITIFLLSLFIIYLAQAADTISDESGFVLKTYSYVGIRPTDTRFDANQREIQKLKDGLYRVDLGEIKKPDGTILLSTGTNYRYT